MFYLFVVAGDGTQGLLHGKYALYYWPHFWATLHGFIFFLFFVFVFILFLFYTPRF
jgi:hypothetical protein